MALSCKKPMMTRYNVHVVHVTTSVFFNTNTNTQIHREREMGYFLLYYDMQCVHICLLSACLLCPICVLFIDCVVLALY